MDHSESHFGSPEKEQDASSSNGKESPKKSNALKNTPFIVAASSTGKEQQVKSAVLNEPNAFENIPKSSGEKGEFETQVALAKAMFDAKSNEDTRSSANAAPTEPCKSQLAIPSVEGKLENQKSLAKTMFDDGSKSSSNFSRSEPSQPPSYFLKYSHSLIERLQRFAQTYKSAFLFIYEATLYEILLSIIKECISESQAAMEAKAEAHELLNKHGKSHEPIVQDEVIRSKNAITLKSILERIRAQDVTGQMLHCIGVMHLWTQFRSNEKLNCITSADVSIFHHFIRGRYSDVLDSYHFNCKDSETGVVCLMKEDEYTSSGVDQVVDQVDNALMKIIFTWPKKLCAHFARKAGKDSKRIPFLSVVCGTCLDPTKQIATLNDQNDDASFLLSHTVLIRRKQEALGCLYLKDFMHRWYMNKSENSIVGDGASTSNKESTFDLTTYINKVKETIE